MESLSISVLDRFRQSVNKACKVKVAARGTFAVHLKSVQKQRGNGQSKRRVVHIVM